MTIFIKVIQIKFITNPSKGIKLVDRFINTDSIASITLNGEYIDIILNNKEIITCKQLGMTYDIADIREEFNNKKD